MTQSERILRHLRDVGEIDPMTAIRDYGIMRLGARIWDLKRDGHPIETRIKTGKNRYGEDTHWAVYRLKEGASFGYTEQAGRH